MRGFRSALLALGLSFALPAHAQTPPALPDKATLRSAYALPASQFAEIDGESVHYLVEGADDRPAILLLHGSYASLRQWDDWAASLSRHYRVVRYDQSPAGLSGPSPSADYGIEHRLRVIDGLLGKLGIEKVMLVGTSSAGLPAAAYAASRPQRIAGLVLSNIAAGPIKFDLSTMPEALKAAVAEDMKHPGWHAPEYWRQILLANVVDQSRVTPELVTRWTDLNSRAARDPAIGKAIVASTSFARTPDDLRAITAPTLLLWSDQDHETPVERDGRQALDLLASQDKALEVVENCGHMMPLDCPVRSLDQAMPFIERILGK